MAKDQKISDHDLLLEMRGNIQQVKNDVQEMKDNTKSQLQDHEMRLRFLEKYLWIGLGVVFFIQFALTIYLALKK